MNEILQGYPRFQLASCGRTNSLEAEPYALWLIAQGRYNALV